MCHEKLDNAATSITLRFWKVSSESLHAFVRPGPIDSANVGVSWGFYVCLWRKRVAYGMTLGSVRRDAEQSYYRDSGPGGVREARKDSWWSGDDRRLDIWHSIPAETDQARSRHRSSQRVSIR